MVAHQDEILELQEQKFCVALENEKNRSNDGKVGPDGRFWFGTMDDEEIVESGAYSRHPQQGLICHLKISTFPIPSLGAQMETHFYFADSKVQTILEILFWTKWNTIRRQNRFCILRRKRLLSRWFSS